MRNTATIILKGNPLSTNNCYFHGSRGLTFIKANAKKLKESYGKQAASQWKKDKLPNPLEISISIFFGDKRKRDWDNYHKLSMDSLTGIVWEADSQIQKATVTKGYDKANPRLEITIFKLSTGTQQTA